MQNHNRKDRIIEIINIVMGNLVITVGITFFILPLDIPPGGATGITATLQPIFSLSPCPAINGLTIGLYLLGATSLRKRFALKTVISTIVYPLFISILDMLWSGVQMMSDPLLVSIYAGVCTGIGIRLVYHVDGSTGGMDIPLLITNKYTKIALLALIMYIDGTTILLRASVYGMEIAMIGPVSVWVCRRLIDKVATVGSHEAKNVMIISDKFEGMVQVIYQSINRDTAVLRAEGSYTKASKPVTMMMVVKKQFSELNHIIAEVDPGALVTAGGVSGVQGEGFTYQEQL